MNNEVLKNFLKDFDLENIENEYLINSLYQHYLNSQTDKSKLNKLKKDIEKLKSEIDDYCWNINDLSAEEQQNIIDTFKMLRNIFNNKIFIRDLDGNNSGKRINIRISNRIFVDGVDFGSEVTQKSTLYFINCKHMTIIINSKVNHLTFENCEGVNVKTIGGSISGLDTIHCKNVSHVLDYGHIYLIDVSNSYDCTYYLNENVALNTSVITMDSMNLLFYTLCQENGSIKDKYLKNRSFFDKYKIYNFITNGDKIFMKDVTT